MGLARTLVYFATAILVVVAVAANAPGANEVRKEYSIGFILPAAKSGKAPSHELDSAWIALQLFLNQLDAPTGKRNFIKKHLLRIDDAEVLPKIKLIPKWEKTHPEGDGQEPEEIAREFAADPSVVAVIGHAYSREALKVGEIYQKAGLVMISPKASNPDVTGKSDWVFSMIYDDLWQGAVLAAYVYNVLRLPEWCEEKSKSAGRPKPERPGDSQVKKQKTNAGAQTCESKRCPVRRVAVIHSKESAYSRRLLKNFVAQSKNVKPPPESVEYSELQEKIDLLAEKGNRVDIDCVVVLLSSSATLDVIETLRENDVAATIVVPDALAERRYADAVNRAMQGLRDDSAKARRLKKQKDGSSVPPATKRASNGFEPRVLVANPYFSEMSPVVSHDFRVLYRTRQKEKLNRQEAERSEAVERIKEDLATIVDETDSVPEKVAGQGMPQESLEPTNMAILYVDAALLVVEAIRSLDNKEDKQPWTALELRPKIKTFLKGLGRDSALDGLSGKLFFDPESGASKRDLIFSWMRKGNFTPAFTQLTTAPNDHHERDEEVDVLGTTMLRRHVVLVGMDFYRINEVDLVGQRFDMEVLVWFKWVGPDGLFEEPQTGTTDDEEIRFWNGIFGIEDHTMELVERGCVSKVGYNYVSFKVKGTYLTEFKLKEFPFDQQRVDVKLSLSPGSDKLLLVVDKFNLVPNPDFQIFPKQYNYIWPKDPDEYLLTHAAGTWRLRSRLGDPYHESESGRGVEFSVYRTEIEFGRNPWSYLILMLLPLGILNGVSLAVFWVPLRDFGVRITLVLTAMLSVLVFHLAQAGELPKVGYLTRADLFFIGAYLSMSVNIGVTILIQWLRNKEEDKQRFDWFAKKDQVSQAQFVNSVGRYVLSAITVSYYLYLIGPVLRGKISFGTIIYALCCTFAVWLVYEFFAWNPNAWGRLKGIFWTLWRRRAT
ncbi:hypothetical protein ACFL2Q_04860 [Thermodesulfobacteriota bacterium]